MWISFLSKRHREEICLKPYFYFHVTWFIISQHGKTHKINLVVSVTQTIHKNHKFVSCSAIFYSLSWITIMKSRCLPQLLVHSRRLIQHLKTWLLLLAVSWTSVYVASLPKLTLVLLITVVIFLRKGRSLLDWLPLNSDWNIQTTCWSFSIFVVSHTTLLMKLSSVML